LQRKIRVPDAMVGHEETRWQVAGEAIDELGGWKARSMRKLQPPIRTRQTTSANAESSKQKPD
jgi:hypothetical protein